MYEAAKVSVIVLNYNGARFLGDCLSSLLTQSYPKIEILVVDNGSRDDSEAIAKRYGVRFLALGRNYGFSIANNLAAKVAEGKYILFLNNDMRLDPECVEELVKVIERDEKIFAVDCKQFSWDGKTLLHGVTILTPYLPWKSWFPGWSVTFTGHSEEPIEVPWGCAGNLMVLRDAFISLGGFDETFFINCEDLDLCWRSRLVGWKTVYVPNAIVYHRLSSSVTSDKIRNMRVVSGETNFLRFIIKTHELSSILRLLIVKLLQMMALIFKGRVQNGIAIGHALLSNLRMLNDTLKERRKLRAQVRDSITELGG